MPTRGLVVLHLSPHPDDELIGPPATLMALRDAGHTILSFFCTFGRPADAARRRAEAVEASVRAGFEFLPPEHPALISYDDDLDAAQGSLADEIERMVVERKPAILLSSSPHDRHYGHEVVARAVRDTLEAVAKRGEDIPAWWMWGIWADLPLPTIAVGFEQRRLNEIVEALSAYGGELSRNDYSRLVRGRAEMNAALGPERVFGFGSSADEWSYVELLTEAVLRAGSWRLGRPRWLDPAAPLAEPGELAIDEWIHASSVTTVFGPPRASGAAAPSD